MVTIINEDLTIIDLVDSDEPVELSTLYVDRGPISYDDEIIDEEVRQGWSRTMVPPLLQKSSY